MTSSITFQQLTLLTEEIMIKEGIKEYDLCIEGDSEKGGNYIGDVTFFSVVPRGKNNIYNMVIKSAKGSERIRELMDVPNAFRRECFMYQVVFPEMRKFLESLGNQVHLDYVPKIYSACEEDKKEALILENLSCLGYQVRDRQKAMDLEHALLVLKNIGRHHAISLAMRKKIPILFEEITKDLTNRNLEFCDGEDEEAFYKPIIERACELLEKSNKKDLAKKVEENIKDNIVTLTLSETPVEDRLVICHGDCWNNNILFKYENMKPSELYFVDFQQSRLASPVTDLSFFIYTSCGKSVLDNFDLLLQTYYASLSATLDVLGCDSGDIYTYGELVDHWNKYAACGLIHCTFFLRIQLLCEEEVPDLNASGCFDEIFSGKIRNEELYNSRIVDVFTHFAEKFL